MAGPGGDRPTGGHLAAIGLVSAATLAAEVSYTRAIAIQHWHDLAPVVIGIALVGFGAAGTLGALLPGPILRHPEPWAYASAVALAILIPLAPTLAGWVPLHFLAVAWDPWQTAWLALYCGAYALPFLAGALFLTIAWMRWPKEGGRVYAANLIGSAFGAVVCLPILQCLGPAITLRWCMIAAGGGAILRAGERTRFGCLPVLVLGIAALAADLPILRFNEYKEMPQRLREPGAWTIDRRETLLGRLDVVESPGLHDAPGWSLNAEEDVPRQYRLVLDGDQGSPIVPAPMRKESGGDLPPALGAAPYAVGPRASALILQGAGGWDARLAEAAGVPRIVVVEPDGRTARRLLRFFPATALVLTGEARRVLSAEEDRYDAIVTRIFSVPVGAPAARESYEWTVEAFGTMLDRLSPEGVIAVEVRLAPLPREIVRAAATAIAALEARGLPVRERIALLHDWGEAVLLVKREPFRPAEIARLRAFAERWSFDLGALPGLGREEAGRFHAREGADYYKRMDALLRDPVSRGFFLRDYVFDVRPATDDRPFFHKFFRWGSIGHLRRTMGPDWLRHAGWGYPLSVAALAVVIALGAVGILLPLVLRRVPGLRRSALYFGAIGLGFLLVEIGLLQKATLVVGTPAAALGIVLAAMLAGAGLGSLASRALPKEGLPLWGILTGGAGLAGLWLLGILFRVSAAWPLALRGSAVAALLILVALPMGFWLPHGMRRIADTGPGAVAWAWGINGFASVAGALLASLLAMHLGLRALLALAAFCYLVAGYGGASALRER